VFHQRFVSHLVPVVLAATLTLAGQAGSAYAAPPAGTASIVAWNGIALRTAVTIAKQFQPQSFVYISFAQAAVYDAVVNILGGYRPYHLHLAERHPDASVDAAVATAAYAVLVHYFPGQQTALGADYTTALAAITDGAEKTDGIAVGQAAAESIIAFRQGDGLEADIGFTMPAPGPGIWQLPSPQTPQTPWLSQLRPFMLESPDQFRPDGPPELDSRQYARDYNEVKTMGVLASTVRTAEQTDAARFWTANAPMQYNTAFQAIALNNNLGPMQAARLFAMGDLVGADALIACFDAKYEYLAWRPIFAIAQGDTDGNPWTAGDPTWQPLGATPNHPEYPSGHACLTEAEAYVFMAFFGTSEINLDLTSTVPNLLHPTRHFQTVNDLVTEIVNARVWIGFHFRSSDLAGVRLGQHVASWALRHYFQRVY
jgi:hypothetical protein